VTELEEQELDVGRYRGLLAARWWLPVGGLVLGVVAGLALAAAGGSVWKASALISLGQPFSPTGSAPVASFATNPRAVAEIIRSESALKETARKSGMRLGNLRGHVTSGQVGAGTGPASRNVTLIQLTVQGPKPTRVEKAADALAHIVIEDTTQEYVGTKIAALQNELQSLDRQIGSQTRTVQQLNDATGDKGLAPLDRLALVTQLNGSVQLLGQLQEQRSTALQQLALAQNVESATIVREAAAVKTTARSARTSMLVGALIGLILGGLAAILWEPLTRLASRR
jgi:uncharacterized protein involved in exopolysaccharide biosynthesis